MTRRPRVKLEPEQGYVRRLDPDWIALIAEYKELKQSLYRTERYLVGGFDDDGNQVIGIASKLDGYTKSVDETLAAFSERIDRSQRLVTWLVGGVWAIVLLFIGSYFASLPVFHGGK